MVALYPWNPHAFRSLTAKPRPTPRKPFPATRRSDAAARHDVGPLDPGDELGLVTMPPLPLTALRFAVAVPLLFLFVVGRQRLPWRAFPHVAALGILGIGVGQVTQTLGVVGTSASVGTILSATIPVFVVVFAALRLKQAVSGRQALGLLAAFAGIALVASGNGREAPPASETTVAGVSLMLLSALAVAFYYVWSVELTNTYGTATLVAWS